MSNYNSQLQSNNTDLQQVLQTLQTKAAGGEQATPEISVNPKTGLITATAGTKSTTKQLTTQAAQTIIPGTSDKTIASGKYLTGTQTIKGDSNLIPANIVSGKSIFGVAGNAQVGTGGGTSSSGAVSTKAVNFYDYDGTVLHSYSVEEAQALTELPVLPEHDGLICQGWNYDLASIKSYNREVNVGAMYTTDDGTTRIYIHLEDGRTSPMLGVCTNGTVTVDWGDGTTPDTLTGTSISTVKWTPTHNYAAPGDYVIRLTVSGSMGFVGVNSSNQYACVLRYTSGADTRNYVYRNAVQKIEIGSSVTSIGSCAFNNCYSLSSITIPSGVTSIGNYAFRGCYSLSSITIPSGVTSIGIYAFYYCYSLSNITIPSSATSIGSNAFGYCHSLSSITMPSGVTSIGNYAFYYCYSLSSITIPSGVTSIGSYAFHYCSSLSGITIPSGVTSIGNYAFYYCYGIRYYDFTSHTAVPTLSSTNAFKSIVEDCEIRVPAALYDEWIAATNWSTYASYIKAV